MFSYNGSGIGILSFLSNLSEIMSQLVIIILLILMSTGWGVRNKEAPALDVLVPIILLVVIVQIMVTVVTSIVEESMHTFTDFDGIPGYMIISIRCLLWLWFVLSM